MERTDPPLAAEEKPSLDAFLDYHRATLWAKAHDLDAGQLARRLEPSTMTLAGMVKHLALVEDWWFTCVLGGAEYPAPWDAVDWESDADWEWHTATQDAPEELWATWQTSVDRSRAACWGAGLDALSVKRDKQGERFSLRWISLHMIEEYARHNGHADLIRESIDGATGE